MAVDKQDALIRELKRQVRDLHKREEKARQQMKIAVKQASQLGKSYKTRLLRKLRVLTSKVADAEAAAFVKAVADLEKRVVNKLGSKTKLLATVINRIEKSGIGKLVKRKVGGKARVVKKRRKSQS